MSPIDMVSEQLSCWSRHHDSVLFPLVTCLSPTLSGRIKNLVKNFKIDTPGGAAIAQAVANVCEKSLTDCVTEYSIPLWTVEETKEQTQNDGTKVLVKTTRMQTEEEANDRVRWESLRKELRKLLPDLTAIDAEKILKETRRVNGENLNAFVTRYIRSADNLKLELRNAGQTFNDKRAVYILYSHMPTEVKRLINNQDFNTCTLRTISRTVSQYCNWKALEESEKISNIPNDDKMDIDALEDTEEEELDYMGNKNWQMRRRGGFNKYREKKYSPVVVNKPDGGDSNTVSKC